ncbi:hypothetical protein HAX54_048575, partial [Datura stramonium]|nr:hypothetical protein [Datura stramonium]
MFEKISGIMAISNQQTCTHGGRDGKPPPKKPSTDIIATKIRTKKRNDKAWSRNLVEVDIEATEQMSVQPPQTLITSNIPPLEDIGEQSTSVEELGWKSKF